MQSAYKRKNHNALLLYTIALLAFITTLTKDLREHFYNNTFIFGLQMIQMSITTCQVSK